MNLTNKELEKIYNILKAFDEGFAEGWGQIATLLLVDTPGGKQTSKGKSPEQYPHYDE